MRLRPTRCPPDVVLETPYDADPQYHQDWTIVKGSNYDPEAWAREKQLRDQRNTCLAQGLLRLMLRDLRLASAPPRSGHNAFQVAMQVRVDECAWMG